MKIKYQKLVRKSLIGALATGITFTTVQPILTAQNVRAEAAQHSVQAIPIDDFIHYIKAVAFTDNTFTELKSGFTRDRLKSIEISLGDYGNVNPEKEAEALRLYTIAKDLFPEFAYKKALTEIGKLEQQAEAPDFLTSNSSQFEIAEAALYDTYEDKRYFDVLKEFQRVQKIIEGHVETYIYATIDHVFVDKEHTIVKPDANLSALASAKKLISRYVRTPAAYQALTKAFKDIDPIIFEAEEIQKARKSVQALFKDANQTELASGVTKNSINTAANLVGRLASDQVRKPLEASIAKANQLFAANQEIAAKQSVADLFTDTTKTALKKTTVAFTIYTAEIKVNELPNSTVKTALQNDLKLARELLEKETITPGHPDFIVAVTKRVADLFTDETKTAVKASVTKDLLRELQALATQIPNQAIKQQLLADISTANTLYSVGQLEKPTIDKYTEKDAYITGTATGKDITYVGLFVNGVRVKLAFIAPDKTFKISSEGYGLKAGQTFEVRAYTIENYASQATKATVQAPAEGAYKLTAEPITMNSTQITGEVGPSVDSVRLVVDGTVVKTGQITDGTYKITASGYIKANSEIQVIGLKNRVETVRTNVSMISPIVVLAEITSKTDMISGQVEAGSASKIRVSINGVAVRTAPIQADGTFASYIGKQKVGTVIKVEVYDTQGYNNTRTNTVTISK